MLAVSQKENSNRENSMSNLNLKIEYVDGKLVALERNGFSFMNTDVTGIFFNHTLKTSPQLNIEMGGTEVKESSTQPAPQPHTEAVASGTWLLISPRSLTTSSQQTMSRVLRDGPSTKTAERSSTMRYFVAISKRRAAISLARYTRIRSRAM